MMRCKVLKNKVISISVLVLVLVLLFALAPSCGEGEEPAPFSMTVIPEHMEDTIAGQRCVFLVVVEDQEEGSGKGESVNISATAPGASVAVDPEAIAPGDVAEVTVIPDEATAGSTLTLTIEGERKGLEQTALAPISVGESIPDPEGLAAYAIEIRPAQRFAV